MQLRDALIVHKMRWTDIAQMMFAKSWGVSFAIGQQLVELGRSTLEGLINCKMIW